MNALHELPFWSKLNPSQRELLQSSALKVTYEKGVLIHGGSLDCTGLFLVLQGQLRVHIISEEGRELTLYRLFSRDMCLLSASCMIRGLLFDVMVTAAEETKALLIPAGIYQTLMEESLPVSSYTNELMASHFSDVMWLMDQIMNKKLDGRLAAFLLEESNRTDDKELSLTHDEIAKHLGSAREVISRMLKHFQREGLVQMSRGRLFLSDFHGLEKLAVGSIQ